MNTIINEDVERITEEFLPWDTFRGCTMLVTGASGMIPSYIVYTLLGLNDFHNLGIKVLALVRNEKKARGIFGELLKRNDLELAVQDITENLCVDGPIDYIFHGASPARPQQHKASPVDTIRANLTGTINLLDLAVAKSSKGFVLMSSSEVYGKVDSVNIISENDYGWLDPLDPRSCYSEGKRAAETLCASFQVQHGVNCTVPRFAHIYGPGMSLSDGRVQADFAANVVHGENIVMKSDGSSKRAYTYVSDAICGMFYALLKGTDMAYNIADSDSVISIRQLAEAFIASRPEKGLELVIEIDKDTAGKYNPAKYIGLDNSRIKALGWTPKVGIAEGTKRMVDSYL
jgi:nucleoside-diphosphate-sugar epimerase